MNRKKLNRAFLIMIICGSGIFFSSCNERLKEGTILFTQVAGDLNDIDYISGKSWRYITNSRIVALDPENLESVPKVLTNDYFSSCSPQVSSDGKFMVFAAQKKQNDVWQIWEMNLENLKVKQITSSTEDCIDPTYLPDGRLLFSKSIKNDIVHTGHSLFTCNLDGSKISRITYNPHAYFASSILKDGRILTISRQLYPDQRDGMFMVLRPDGTKEELFYQGLKGSDLHSRGWETNNGKVIFIESDINVKGNRNIISISYNRPLHSKVNLSSDIEGDFYSISPLKDNRILVSYRASNDENYALYEFDTESKILHKEAIYKDKDYNALEAIVVKKQERPRKLPSEVNMNVKTGLLLCQDINFSDIQSAGNTVSTSKAAKIEVLGLDSSFGMVDVEKDGSFYLKVLADMPFRIQTIDENGNSVNGPSSWIYLRPNERRGCVGCHENNEQVPENRQPLSVRKDPIIIPVYITEINKQMDSLK